MTVPVTGIYRYPVKGLSPAPVERIDLTPGRGLPLDRAYALALPRTKFDPAKPEWLQKTHFLMLQRDEALAALETAVDPETGKLSIRRNGESLIEADLDDDAGRAAIETFFADYMEMADGERPRLVAATGHMFSDHPEQVVSIINQRSIADLQGHIGAPVDPLRFRANVYFENLPAFTEFDWIGGALRIGGARLEVTRRIPRCAATHVEPGTGRRDMNVVKTLTRAYGHFDMGIYARVIASGAIARGDEIKLEN
jgi:hypothetical protein